MNAVQVIAIRNCFHETGLMLILLQVQLLLIQNQEANIACILHVVSTIKLDHFTTFETIYCVIKRGSFLTSDSIIDDNNKIHAELMGNFNQHSLRL